MKSVLFILAGSGSQAAKIGVQSPVCCCPEPPAGNGLGWQELSCVIQHLGETQVSLRGEIIEFKDLFGSVCSSVGSAGREGSPREQSGERSRLWKL